MGATTISLVNQTGGGRQTPAAVSRAVAPGRRGHRVLPVDLDPQAKATSAVGIDGKDMAGTYDAILDETAMSQCVIRVEEEHVSLVPSSAELSGAEVEL